MQPQRIGALSAELPFKQVAAKDRSADKAAVSRTAAFKGSCQKNFA
jgi:hypothetical protein